MMNFSSYKHNLRIHKYLQLKQLPNVRKYYHSSDIGEETKRDNVLAKRNTCFAMLAAII